MTRHSGQGELAKPATDMDVKSSKTRAAAIAIALIMTSLGATACSSASGSSGGGTQVYVAQESGRDVLVVHGDSVSMAENRDGHGNNCTNYNTMLDHAEHDKLDPNNTDGDGRASYEDVNRGTMNEDRRTVLWSAESDDHREVVSIQFDAPLEGLVTIDGQIYVPVDSDQGKSLLAEQRTRLCG